MITVVGFPRSGTHWLKKMLEHALGEELAHSHPYPEVVESQYVLIVRDPRDTFASRWRMEGTRFPARWTEEEHLDHFLHRTLLRAPSWHIGWGPYTRKLLELAARFPHSALLVRYEDVYAAPEATLAKLIATLGRDISEARVADAVERTRGVRCDPSSFPADENMGRPGKWEAELKQATVRTLLEDCGELMAELGYISRAELRLQGMDDG